MRRGVLGNNGNTELTVFSLQAPVYPRVVKKIPTSWLRPVLNTTEKMPRVLTASTAPEMSFLPPPAAYTETTNEHKVAKKIIRQYLRIPKTSTGSQKKNSKSPERILKDLKSNQKDFGTGWVLIQRASRSKGEVALLEEDGILLSTNLLMVRFPSLKERLLFASWMLSVFGQLQLELVAAGQEGMRKLEVTSIKKVHFPKFSDIPKSLSRELASHIETESALHFSDIQLRPSDHLWAEVVCPETPAQCLEQALSLFQELVDERIGLG